MRIERLHPLDAEAAQQLLLMSIGSVYELAALRRMGLEEDAVALSAHKEPRDLLGVGIAQQPGPHAAAPFGDQAAAALRGRRTGWLSQLAIRSGARGQGMGKALICGLSSWMLERGCDQLAAVAWLSGGAPRCGPGGRGCFGLGCSCRGRLYVMDLSPEILRRWQQGDRDGTR
jgi:hypothetical protein